MDRIQIQASKLWDILFDEETANTYQNALNLTGNILKESAQLIWLVLCSFFVFGAWFADASTKTGKGVRDWIDNKEAIAPSPDAIKQIAAPKGKSLLDTGRESVSAALAKAREELGLDPNAPLATPREDSPVAKLVTPTETKTVSPASTTSNSSTASSSTDSSSAVSSTPTSSATATSPSAASASPSAGAAKAKPATSEGQEIGSSYAASTGSGSPSGGFGKRAASSSQSGSPQSSKHGASRDFDDDIEEEDFGDDAGSSWPPQTED